MKRFLQAAALSGLFLVAPMAHDNLAHAQVALSPRGSVSQTIDGTSIDIEYSRPALRGRTGLFGGQIWWGHIWTPGADWATILEVNKDITIDGVEVPAGKYSMWMVVDPGDWEVILDPEWKQFHLPEPQKNGDEITFWVTPDTTASLTETLTFDFPENSTTGTTLRLRFETHEVSMDIAVQSRLKMAGHRRRGRSLSGYVSDGSPRVRMDARAIYVRYGDVIRRWEFCHQHADVRIWTWSSVWRWVITLTPS